jgi:hypothetical protein
VKQAGGFLGFLSLGFAIAAVGGTSAVEFGQVCESFPRSLFKLPVLCCETTLLCSLNGWHCTAKQHMHPKPNGPSQWYYLQQSDRCVPAYPKFAVAKPRPPCRN